MMMLIMLIMSQISLQNAVHDMLCYPFLSHELLIISSEWSQMTLLFVPFYTTSRATFRQCQKLCCTKMSTMQSSVDMFFFFMFHFMHYEINISTTFKALKDFYLLL